MHSELPISLSNLVGLISKPRLVPDVRKNRSRKERLHKRRALRKGGLDDAKHSEQEQTEAAGTVPRCSHASLSFYRRGCFSMHGVNRNLSYMILS